MIPARPMKRPLLALLDRPLAVAAHRPVAEPAGDRAPRLLERRHAAVTDEADHIGILRSSKSAVTSASRNGRRVSRSVSRVGIARCTSGMMPQPPRAGAAIIRAMLPPATPEIERLRSRALATYFTAVALTSIAYIATFTVASIAAPEMTGSAGSSGWPSAIAVAGTALAASLLSSVMARRGRRAGIVLGLAVAVVGGALAILAVMAASLILLLVSSALVGFGNAALNLSRYAAADLYPVERRAGALGFVVWGSTIGAVVGPNLVAPAGAIAPNLGLLPLAGGFAMAFVFLLAALGVAALGPRAPIQPHLDEPTRAVGAARTSQRGLLAELMRKPQGRTALVALVTSQLVMTLVMTMTPYHLHAEGHGLETVGLVISAHTLGHVRLLAAVRAPDRSIRRERHDPDRVLRAGCRRRRSLR